MHTSQDKSTNQEKGIFFGILFIFSALNAYKTSKWAHVLGILTASVPKQCTRI